MLVCLVVSVVGISGSVVCLVVSWLEWQCCVSGGELVGVAVLVCPVVSVVGISGSVGVSGGELARAAVCVFGGECCWQERQCWCVGW